MDRTLQIFDDLRIRIKSLRSRVLIIGGIVVAGDGATVIDRDTDVDRIKSIYSYRLFAREGLIGYIVCTLTGPIGSWERSCNRSGV